MRAQPVSSQRKPMRCIFYLTRHNRSNLQQQEPNNTQSNMMTQRRIIFKKAKKKSLRISIILVTAFIVCWTPYYFMMIAFIFLNPNDKVYIKKYFYSFLRLQSVVILKKDRWRVAVSDILFWNEQLIDKSNYLWSIPLVAPLKKK